MLRFLSALLLVVAIASAIPYNDAVPEESEYMSNANIDFNDAKQHIQSLMESGKSNKECRDLATESKKAIEDDVKADQKILDAIPDGSACKKEGQALVSSSKSNKDQAKSKKDDAKKKLDKAKAATVDFGSTPYNQLTPGQCGTFFNHPAYTKAKKALDTAQSAYDKAEGEHKAAQAAYNQAVAASDLAKTKCLCLAKRAYDSAWKQVQKSAPNAGLNWKRAHNMECVLDGTPVSKCKVPPQPALKKPKLVSAAANMNSGTCNPGDLSGKIVLVQPRNKCGVSSNAGLYFTSKSLSACQTHTNYMVPLGYSITVNPATGTAVAPGNQHTPPYVAAGLSDSPKIENIGYNAYNQVTSLPVAFGWTWDVQGTINIYEDGKKVYTSTIRNPSGVGSMGGFPGNAGNCATLIRMTVDKAGTVSYSWGVNNGSAKTPNTIYTSQKKATALMYFDVIAWKKAALYDMQIVKTP